MRRRVNQALGEQLRVEYRGKAGPALIKVFDESNTFLRTATKLEVHQNGLLHHSALLLVRLGDKGVMYYRRRPQQTYAGKFDFLGGHTADIDQCPLDTARREANEELHLSLNGRRLNIADEWIHQIGESHRFVSYAPQDRERSTLFVVVLPSHPALAVRLTDEAADGIQILRVPKYETATFGCLLDEYLRRKKEFASGAERIFITYDRDPDIKRQIDAWFY